MPTIKDLYSIIRTLKTTRRQGWLLAGQDSDVIASHSYGAMCLGLYLAKKQKVDVNKVVQMLLVHDWVMAKMEDVTPLSGKYGQKRQMEEQAKQLIYKLLPSEIQDDYISLFNEFNSLTTPESQVALEADKLETLFQGEAFEEETGDFSVLGTFFDTHQNAFKTDLGKAIFQELRQRDLGRSK